MSHTEGKLYDVAVIGGGAAGLTAAIAAARSGAKTIILEHMDRVGKKILSTGNGKCNYTNALQGIAYYRGEDPAFVLPVFEQFGLSETIAFFRELGIYPREKRGYYYPASGQAASVLDVLRMETEYQGVTVWTSFSLTSLQCPSPKTKNLTFSIAGEVRGDAPEKRKIRAKTIIFATGLLAAPKTGSDGSAFPYIEALGHHFIDIVPALVPLQGKQSFFKSLAGIRAEMRLDLYLKNEQIASEQGELQLTDYGISGIPVFQVSRYATRALRQGKNVYVLIDFMPQLTKKELQGLLRERFFDFSHGKNAISCMTGLLPRKLNEVLLREAKIPLEQPGVQLSSRQLAALGEEIKALRVDICGSKGIDQGQVCAGGIDTRELDNRTLESRLISGVFFAGEVIDIDGTCGGYNLQWAWSSGYVAGSSAARKAGEQ
ncbi:MAG: NAD(P)/FAD-dependent oxidoreductase [Roseburia sp.]